MNTATKLVPFAAVLLAFGLTASADPAASGASGGATFSHKAHLAEGADCGTCHKSVEGSQFPQVQTSACEDCHDDGAPAHRPVVRARKLPFTFKHKLHEDAAECTDCHIARTKDEVQASRPVVEFTACQACHAENDVDVAATACAKCHGRDQRRQAPADHAHAWLKEHGRESRFRVFADHGRDCGQCHRADGCQNCHRTTRPASHTGLWRTRTHGVAADWDRDSCKTCHETGACIRCHRSVAPLNHKGAWRSTHGLAAQSRSNEHCAVCHQLSWCAACHRGSR